MMDEFDTPRKNAALRVGIVAGSIMIVVHLVFLLITHHTGSADFLAWIVEWIVFVFAGHSAAHQQLQSQLDGFEPLQGVRGAGIGAALITALIVWIFVIGRDLFIVSDLFSSAFGILRIPIDLSLALGLGGWGTHSVIRRHTGQQHYNL